MELADLKVDQLSMEIGERVWSLVMPWDYFAKGPSKNYFPICRGLMV